MRSALTGSSQHGVSGGRQVFFLFVPHGCGEAAIRIDAGLLKGRVLHDVLTGACVTLEPDGDGLIWRGTVGPIDLAVLVEK